jgi:hypothetical protein
MTPRGIARGSLTAFGLALLLGGCAGRSSESGKAEVDGGIRLSPNPAFAASRIDVVFDDPRIDPSKCRFEWKRNGSVIGGARTSALEPVHFSKGQLISLDVFVEDPAGGEPRRLSANVEIVNTPPKVLDAQLALSASSGQAEVQGSVQSVDPDGDPVSYTYRWLKNDQPIDGESRPNLFASHIVRGDRVVLEVVANDGEVSSPPFRSEPLRLENHPPQFSSQPIAPKTSDLWFRYQAVAADPDNDRLRYELVRGPVGMTVAPEGAVAWELPPKNQRIGEHRVSIKVSDAKGGEAIQEFSVRFD